MPSKTFSNRISDAQVMCTGMANNETEAAKRGWSSEQNDKLGTTRTEAINLNDEQERLKAALKTATAALDAKMAELGTQMKEAKKVVKLGFPQSQWKEFGVTDKR